MCLSSLYHQSGNPRLYVHFQIFKYLNEFVNRQKDKDIIYSWLDLNDIQNQPLKPEFLKTEADTDLEIGLPEQGPEILLTPNIGVIGVGGAGGNPRREHPP